MGLRRWLDPPEVRERKRQQRATGVRPAGGRPEFGIAVPAGCVVPLAIAAAVLVGAGVLIGKWSNGATISADHVVVRVIDDGAAGGPQVISTAVASLR